jgi:DnaJ-class molecular chaperone
MAFTQRPARDVILPMSLDASCIECHGEQQPDGEKCQRCWGMTRTEQAASIEETRRLLSLAFTQRKAS